MCDQANFQPKLKYSYAYKTSCLLDYYVSLHASTTDECGVTRMEQWWVSKDGNTSVSMTIQVSTNGKGPSF